MLAAELGPAGCKQLSSPGPVIAYAGGEVAVEVRPAVLVRTDDAMTVVDSMPQFRSV